LTSDPVFVTLRSRKTFLASGSRPASPKSKSDSYLLAEENEPEAKRHRASLDWRYSDPRREIVAYFQVPSGRVFNDPASGLQDWPKTPEGYRLFVTGSGGEERIGIHTGQQIDLQLTGGKDCRIESREAKTARQVAKVTGRPVVDVPSPVVVSVPVATSDNQKFSLTADRQGVTVLYATDAANNIKAELQVAVGNFAEQPDMLVDLIAQTCKGSDSLKIHALQRMLNNQYLGLDAAGNDKYTNPDNIFEQNSPANFHATYLNMTCGLVAKWRGAQIFDQVAEVGDDWYRRALHQPLAKKIKKREDLKYKPERIRTLEMQIFEALRKGKAVRVGVVDSPTTMTPEGGSLVAYRAGGHTVLIVGARKTATWRFLYIDPWGGGSKMKYEGGIAGNKFQFECSHLGLLVSTHDPARKVRPSDSGNNIIRQDVDTQYSFNYNAGNFLEVVSAPFSVLGR
jgi:hypothetical protein